MHQEQSPGETWFAAASTVTGAGHLAKNAPCQDRHGWKELPDGTFIAAVSDGAGSRPRSGEGAELVVNATLRELERLASDPPATAAAWNTAMRELFVDVWEALSNFAEAEFADITEFNATLSCIIVTSEICVLGQIGDGAIVLDLEPDGLTLPIPPENGEYANSTYFINRLTSHKDHVHVRTVHAPIRGIGLITDGLGDYTLKGTSRKPEPRASFWQVFFDRMTQAVGTEDQSPNIRGLLRSSKIQDVFTDDLTLILAVPTAGVHALPASDDPDLALNDEPDAKAGETDRLPQAPTDDLLNADREIETPTASMDTLGSPEAEGAVPDIEADEDQAFPTWPAPASTDAPSVDMEADDIETKLGDRAAGDVVSAPMEPDPNITAGAGEGADIPNASPASDDKPVVSIQTGVRQGETLPPTVNLEDLAPEDVLGQSGGSTVSDLPDLPGHVVKLYRHPVPADLAAKLEWMVTHPPAAAARERLTWPQSLVRDDQGQLAGYVMRRLPAATVPLNSALVRDKARIYKTLKREPFTLRDLHVIAWNLAATINAIHGEGHVIVNLSPGDVYVTAKGHVILTGNDAFQITTGEGRTFPSEGRITPGYASPELAATIAHVQPEHDAFALSILIFQLLMESVHPFRGSTDDVEPPDELALMKRRVYPYDIDRLNPHVRPHPAAPALARLHEDVVSIFQRNFTAGLSHPDWRPGPQDWLRVLESAVPALGKCQRGHWYSTDRPCCLTRGGNDRYCGATVTTQAEPIPMARIDPLTGSDSLRRRTSMDDDRATAPIDTTPGRKTPTPDRRIDIPRPEPVPEARTARFRDESFVPLPNLPDDDYGDDMDEPGRRTRDEEQPARSSAKRFWRRITER